MKFVLRRISHLDCRLWNSLIRLQKKLREIYFQFREKGALSVILRLSRWFHAKRWKRSIFSDLLSLLFSRIAFSLSSFRNGSLNKLLLSRNGKREKIVLSSRNKVEWPTNLLRRTVETIQEKEKIEERKKVEQIAVERITAYSCR